MMLHGEHERSWSLDEVCDSLACPPSWATAQLERMGGAGLVEVADGEWRFAPATGELEQATRALATAYRLHPRDVVRFVFATPGRELKQSRRARRSSVE